MDEKEKPGMIVNVDDSEPALYARSRMLRLAGFTVLEAGRGEEALSLVVKHRPDLVILDVNLPDISGLEICRRIKAEPDTASVIVIQISAFAISAPQATSALDNGADGYLMEPVDPDVFVATVRAMLRLRRAERDLANANRKLARLNQHLRSSNEDLQQFAFMASHDLQEPLRMVNTSAQLLLRQFGHLADPKAAEYGGYITDGVKRMETLIRNVLSYSSTINIADDEELKPADLSVSFNKAVSMLGDSVRENNAVITCDELPVVRGDQEQLAQVFQNLLSNALKYKGSSGEVLVHVGVLRADPEWIFYVSDNGIGFEPQYASRIFGLFKRLHGREYPGTGLGLAICKRIIDRHGGRIWAESKLGAGSTFFFSLPI